MIVFIIDSFLNFWDKLENSLKIYGNQPNEALIDVGIANGKNNEQTSLFGPYNEYESSASCVDYTV